MTSNTTNSSHAYLIQRFAILGSVVALATSTLVAAVPTAGTLRVAELRKVFEKLAAGVPGRIGACARDAAGEACVNGDQRSSLQSVVKLIVGLAVMEEVDRGRWKIDDAVVVKKQDLSVGVQPIAKLIA